MPAFRASILSVGIVLALTFPVPSFAQDMINNLPDYTSAWVMGDLMQRRGRASTQPKKHQQIKKQTDSPPHRPVSAAALRDHATYIPSPDTQTSIERAFAAYVMGQEIDGPTPELLRAVAADSPAGSPFARLLASAVESGVSVQALHKIERDYAGWLTSMGYSNRNLFDVHTAFLMHAWSIANGGVTISDNKAAFRAIRAGLVEMQAREASPKLMTQNNARKQEEAQSFALFTALLVTAWSDADAGQKKVLTESVAALGRRLGANFRRLKLTPDGFEPT